MGVGYSTLGEPLPGGRWCWRLRHAPYTQARPACPHYDSRAVHAPALPAPALPALPARLPCLQSYQEIDDLINSGAVTMATWFYR